MCKQNIHTHNNNNNDDDDDNNNNERQLRSTEVLVSFLSEPSRGQGTMRMWTYNTHPQDGSFSSYGAA